MLILRKMFAKRWKMTVAISTGSLACKSVALEKQETILIHTTVMSYTWQALWKKAENWQC